MSTEARHAPIPPRPSAPPRPSVPPRPATPPDDSDDEPSVFTPRAAREGRSSTGSAGGGGFAGRGTPSTAAPTSSGSPSAGRPAGGRNPSPAEAPAPDGRPSRRGSGARAGQAPRAGVPRPAVPEAGEPVGPPPPPASARFPDAPPSTGGEPRRPGREFRRPGAAVPGETAAETTTRLRPITDSPKAQHSGAPNGRSSAASTSSAASVAPSDERRTTAASASAGRTETRAWSPLAPSRPVGPPPPLLVPDPALSWSAAMQGIPGEERPRHRVRPRTLAAAACFVLGIGLVGGAVAGSWLTGDGGDDASGDHFATAGTLWHNVPVDQLFPPTVQGTGAGPGGADRTWTRIAVAPDSGCARAFDPLLAKVLAPVGCQRLLRATYTDSTQSYVTTVGLLFTKADPAAMAALAHRFRAEHLDRRADLMPRPYAAGGTVAAGFGDSQRASWTLSVLTDAPVVAYAVSGWADGRTVDEPQPAADAVSAGATSAPAQAGLGNEAQGLADRIERRLRQHIGTATESPS
ncbi:hypothetical protein AB0L75_17380 [Streptomyces sp. NPDC052101]|uniref:hypothetical protein n=1 Tax=Streptomyces sp. NPDC052101 TaxID=3155763 RepID=UPI0034292253